MAGRWILLGCVAAALWGCGGGVVGGEHDAAGGDGGSRDGSPGDGVRPGDGPGPDGPVVPPPVVCNPAPGGSTGAVRAPVLRATLAASWDENWLASPAVADIDGDGALEIVAARHSVLYAWRADGTPFWHTAFGQSASTSPEHGTTRMWASPVVGDFDRDDVVEIAVGSDADGSSGGNIAVYDGHGELKPNWPQTFGTTEVRSIAAADVDGDGVIEILVNKTGDGPTTAVYEPDGTLHPNWPKVNASCNPPSPAEPCWDFGGYNQNIGAGDLDGDGVLEVYATPSEPNRLDGSPQSGKVVRYVPAKGEGRTVVADLGSRHAKEILVGDVDGDGRDELYVSVEAETEGEGAALRLEKPIEIRRYDAGTDPTKGVVIAQIDDRLSRVLTAGDVDGDGKQEIVAATFRSGLWLLRPGADPKGPWRVESIDRSSSGFEHAALLTDLDGDGHDELYVASDDQGELRRYAWTPDGVTREVIATRPVKSSAFVWNIMPVPVELVR